MKPTRTNIGRRFAETSPGLVEESEVNVGITRHATGSTEAFSLVELMCVIAIMSIMVGATILFQTAGASLSSAGAQLVELAGQAREHAIAQNAITALIMVSNSSRADWNGRLFVLAQLKPGYSNWTQISKWEMLPTGVVVDPSQSVFSDPTFSNPPSISNQGIVLNASSCLFQLFLPDGSLVASNNGTNPTLYLVSGVMNGSSVHYTAPRASSGGAPINYFEITLNSYTGMTKIDRP